MKHGDLSGPNAISIKLEPSDCAPRYDPVDTVAILKLSEATITERGMSSGLPLVDLVAFDPEGRRYVFVATGRVLLGIAAALRGVNLRNHGVEEP